MGRCATPNRPGNSGTSSLDTIASCEVAQRGKENTVAWFFGLRERNVGLLRVVNNQGYEECAEQLERESGGISRWLSAETGGGHPLVVEALSQKMS